MRALRLAVLLCLLACGTLETLSRSDQEQTTRAVIATGGNITLGASQDQGNSTVKSPIYTILKDLPTLKNLVIFVCGFSTFLILCLLVKIFRSGRRIQKTRKYDIITTPAERVEMTPLNEENDDDDDSTVFDVKYRYR
ncbi:membrane protein FAM174B [Ascaphus truei]|uniref:membrane protein FAM174B n=1 Tax=Ascaphus truei TaxID=8439 RepID=UPI003F5A53E4